MARLASLPAEDRKPHPQELPPSQHVPLYSDSGSFCVKSRKWVVLSSGEGIVVGFLCWHGKQAALAPACPRRRRSLQMGCLGRALSGLGCNQLNQPAAAAPAPPTAPALPAGGFGAQRRRRAVNPHGAIGGCVQAYCLHTQTQEHPHASQPRMRAKVIFIPRSASDPESGM